MHINTNIQTSYGEWDSERGLNQQGVTSGKGSLARGVVKTEKRAISIRLRDTNNRGFLMRNGALKILH